MNETDSLGYESDSDIEDDDHVDLVASGTKESLAGGTQSSKDNESDAVSAVLKVTIILSSDLTDLVGGGFGA